ncbi:hypothetical protein RFI_25020, partial [Reticulomyxa filosa]
KLEALILEQCIQLCNNMVSTSLLQISKNESMQSTNKIIRTFQSTLSASTKQSKKNVPSKTPAMSVLIPFDYTTDSIQMEIHSNDIQVHNMTERLNEKNDHEKKKGSILKNVKVEAVISMQSWNRWCNTMEQISIMSIGCELFWYNAATNTNIICSRCRFFYHKIAASFRQVSSKHLRNAQRPRLRHNFQIVIILLPKYAFVIDVPFAQMMKVVDNAVDEQVGRSATDIAKLFLFFPFCCSIIDLIFLLVIRIYRIIVNVEDCKWPSEGKIFCFILYLIYDNVLCDHLK